jgi:predicted  nucleic acid-binding Zn-ribbon protein
MIERLLQLQDTDTAADQLRYRRAHLPEADVAGAARSAMSTWEQAVQELRGRLDALGSEVERAEHDAADIDTRRNRLRSQLRTIIAPREAEALQHEIATLTAQRDGLDDRELEALEAQAAADDELTGQLSEEPAVRGQLAAAEAALADAVEAVDAELTALEARRAELRGGVDPALLGRYDRLRAQVGVAIARLTGSRCEGCHLDMSAAELDAVKRSPPDEPAECPNCGRMLAR